jgi:hypothetical protein
MNEQPGSQEEFRTRRLSRRQVLVFGSLAAVVPLVPRRVLAASASVPAADGPRALSVRYLEPLAGGEGPPGTTLQAAAGSAVAGQAEPAWRAVPAEQLHSGDASLAGRTLRVRIHGFHGALSPTFAPPAESYALDVLVPAMAGPGGETASGRIPFHAWTHRPAGPNTSPPLSFVLPVTAEEPPRLQLTVHRPGGEPQTYATRFTLGQEPLSPRLRLGHYLISPVPQGWLGEAQARLIRGAASAATILLSFDGAA